MKERYSVRVLTKRLAKLDKQDKAKVTKKVSARIADLEQAIKSLLHDDIRVKTPTSHEPLELDEEAFLNG